MAAQQCILFQLAEQLIFDLSGEIRNSSLTPSKNRSKHRHIFAVTFLDHLIVFRWKLLFLLSHFSVLINFEKNRRRKRRDFLRTYKKPHGNLV